MPAAEANAADCRNFLREIEERKDMNPPAKCFQDSSKGLVYPEELIEVGTGSRGRPAVQRKAKEGKKGKVKQRAQP
jgi:hypothetical protein